jgi:hypothetical protein
LTLGSEGWDGLSQPLQEPLAQEDICLLRSIEQKRKIRICGLAIVKSLTSHNGYKLMFYLPIELGYFISEIKFYRSRCRGRYLDCLSGVVTPSLSA